MSNTNEYEKLIIYFKKKTKYSFISWIFVDLLRILFGVASELI